MFLEEEARVRPLARRCGPPRCDADGRKQDLKIPQEASVRVQKVGPLSRSNRVSPPGTLPPGTCVWAKRACQDAVWAWAGNHDSMVIQPMSQHYVLGRGRILRGPHGGFSRPSSPTSVGSSAPM